MPEINEDRDRQSDSKGRDAAFLARLQSLAQHAEAILFPPFRKGVSAPPDMSGWSRPRRIAFTVSSPWPTTLTSGFILGWDMLLLWTAAALFWSHLAADFVFGPMLGTRFSTSGRTDFPLLVDILGWVIISLLLLMIIPAYWSWIEFFRDPRYSSKGRAWLSVGFVLFLLLWPVLFLEFEESTRLWDVLFTDSSNVIQATVAYCLFVVPVLTYVWRTGVDVFVLLGRVLLQLQVSVPYLVSPLPADSILQLAHGPIPAHHGVTEWRLDDMPKHEVLSVRRWADTKREMLEKGLLPLGVLFAVLALLANTQTFTNAFDTVFEWAVAGMELAEGLSSWVLLGRLFVVAVVAFLLVGMALALFRAFQNMVVHGLIIEACSAVEYAQDQHEDQMSEHEDHMSEQEPRTRRNGCSEWLHGFLGVGRRNKGADR